MIDLDHCKVLDISPLISSRLAVFPGDQPFSRSVALQVENGDPITLSSMTSSLHIGAHADAENHYSKSAGGIEKKSLSPYMGSCQVVEVKIARNQAIQPKDFDISAINTKRILFKTNSFPDPENWNGDFNYISPETIEALAERDVTLVGIDTPSVDAATSKDLAGHHTILKHNISILEGLVLSHVANGPYQLIALPLAIENGDASPVRALLLHP